MYKKQCSSCGKEFESIQPNAKVCSKECRNEIMKNNYGIKNNGMPGRLIGTAHEYKAYLDLIDLGMFVYNQFLPFSKYDAIVLTPRGNILRVDIKTGYRSATSGNIFTPKHKYETDLIVVYVKNENKSYFFIGDKEISPEEVKKL